MTFSETLEEYLMAREQLCREEAKRPPSPRAVTEAKLEMSRAASCLDIILAEKPVLCE